MNIVASLLIGAVTAVAPVTTAPVSWQDCGDGLQCAQIQVPVDWARGSGPKVTIALAKLPAQDQAGKKGVVLVNTGGPGEQITILRQGKKYFADLTKWFDVVIFDPRGFGKSTAINCPIPAPFATEWVFPSKPAYDAYAAKNRTFGQACAKEAGTLSGNLNSWQIAHDMEAIRKALGQARLTFVGNSHGTTLGQAYAELFPRKVGRMYLDSVWNHTTPDLREWLRRRAHVLEANAERYAAWCQSTTTCALHGKDPLAVWDAVMATARREPIPAPEAGPDVRISDTQIASRVNFTWEATWERLAAGLARAQAGDASFFAKVEGAPDPNLSRVILCADMPYPGYDKLKKLETALRRETPRIGWRMVWPMANHCAGLPPTRTYPPHPIKAPGLRPVLIANGDYDDNSPAADGRRLAGQDGEPDIEVVGEAADGAEAVHQALWRRPDVVVMDLRMPYVDGIAAIRQLTDVETPSRVLALTTFDTDEYLFGALQSGAAGFLLKDSDPELLLAAVRALHRGHGLVDPQVTTRLIHRFARLSPVPATGAHQRLTTRELEVLRHLARGLSNAEIAQALTIEEGTVKTHVASLLRKLGLTTRVRAVIYAYEHGLAPRYSDT
ncbi:alpha/beta fold hydrolase [Nonomuraea sp. SYSU D8015]|uniref:alpha/beta fold hydrolase n=1 Tax=Nonomuraea sp. SYSU D8015 TaxID=2593644 RepID=UPI001660E967|nr:alpha/beta fold hydrolase [Nonomuraea sp. SYSU D8015]